jgi:hypothetical protein
MSTENRTNNDTIFLASIVGHGARNPCIFHSFFAFLKESLPDPHPPAEELPKKEGAVFRLPPLLRVGRFVIGPNKF